MPTANQSNNRDVLETPANDKGIFMETYTNTQNSDVTTVIAKTKLVITPMGYTENHPETGYNVVAVDAEWHSPTRTVGSSGREGSPAKYITQQYTFSRDGQNPITIVLWGLDYARVDDPVWVNTIHSKVGELSLKVGHPVIVRLVDDMDGGGLSLCGVPLAKHMYAQGYYSPKDWQGLVGRDLWMTALTAKNDPISKKRCLNGKVKVGNTLVEIDDLIGMFNTSLDNALKSVGVDNPYKGNVEKWSKTRLGGDFGKDCKGHMDLFVMEDPVGFLEYAVGDTVFLYDMATRKVQTTNEIVEKALGFNPGYTLYGENNTPKMKRTSGALVADVFERCQLHKYPSLFRACLLLTDTMGSGGNSDLNRLRAKALEPGTDPWDVHKKMKNDSGFVHGLGMGSIRNYVLLDKRVNAGETQLFNGVVQGGRCVTEEPHTIPYHNRIENVVDIDLSSCYGSALREFDYPFGIPSVCGYSVDDYRVGRALTLGGFLQMNEKDLVPGLWQIAVKGCLPFNQDLVYSKLGLTTEKIKTKLHGGDFTQETENGEGAREIEAAHLGGEFALITKEIELGIITHDVLEVIRAVSTSEELKQWMGLEVVSAGAYLAKNYIADVNEWAEHIIQSYKSKRCGKFVNTDSRTDKWTKLPLEEFIGAFINYRKQVKTEYKNTKDERLNLLQNGVKLFINTTYGCLASPYFPMGNTILANNITAKARCGAWMMSKALGTVQSITDGGMFSADRVFVLDNKGRGNPGFNTLANRVLMLNTNKTRSLKTQPLLLDENGNSVQVHQWLKEVHDTKEYGKRCTELDKVALTHINKFWSNYGLTLKFDIECKYENCGAIAVYAPTSDYLIVDTVGGKDVMRVRGAKDEAHPKKQWLRMLLSKGVNPPRPHYEVKELLGVSDWQKQQDSDLFPGDEVYTITNHKPDNNGFLPRTIEDYKRVSDRRRKTGEATKKARAKDPHTPVYAGYSKDIVDGVLTPTHVTPGKKNKQLYTPCVD